MQNENSITIYVSGEMDNIPEPDMAVFRTRMNKVVEGLQKNTDGEVDWILGDNPNISKNNYLSSQHKNGNNQEDNEENIILKLAQQYKSEKPIYSFEKLVLPDQVKNNLLYAIDAIEVEKVIYEEWGLNEIQPYPRTVLNFYGKSGTGKTLAAHGIAHRLNKTILLASYADIESKYHGEGPKRLKAIFHAAQRDKSLLFIDESDSLLSKRLTDVNTGSEQAINSMRSQLLICLEQFQGIVIFATNLVENYDKAFNTRVKHIEFPLPDEKCRQEIWRNHLPDKLPLADDVSIQELAKIDGVCGREIREAVIDATNRAALDASRQFNDSRKGIITFNNLQEAIERKKAERLATEKDLLTPEEEKEVFEKVTNNLSKN